MPAIAFIPIIFIYLFGALNMLGIRPDLFGTFLTHGAIGAVVFITVRVVRIHSHFFRSNIWLFYLLGLALLGLTLVFGSEIKGAKRWLDLWMVQIQTSELFKILFIGTLAHMASRCKNPQSTKTFVFRAGIVTVIPMILIFVQPDLKTSIILFSLFLIVVAHVGIPFRQIALFLLGIILLLPLVWFGMRDYQKNRILSFLAAEESGGASYNMTQSMIAVGSGGLLGKGLGMGKQSQLAFLPEYHTDFAFSSLVEQFGFFGGLVMIALYCLFFLGLFVRMFGTFAASDPDDRYVFYYLLGLSVIFATQSIINIGMNIGLLPIAGVTLPFVSYGGSSIITFSLALALIPPYRSPHSRTFGQ